MDEYIGEWDTAFIEDEEIENDESSLYYLYKLCLEPTLFEVFPHVWKLLIINAIFRYGTQTRPLSKFFCHSFSIICGLLIQICILRCPLFYIYVFILFCFISMHTTYLFANKYWPFWLSILCITYSIVSEFYFPVPQTWNEIRGVHMIVSMKVISIAFDMKKGMIKHLPNPLEYAGYVFCPSNCLFGPWVSFNTYRSIYNYQSATFDMRWFKRIFTATCFALVFLTMSNCWIYWWTPLTWSWLVAYQEAFSFRSSHYFICYLSEAAMIVGGFDSDSQKKQKELKSIGAYSVTTTTYPLSIEFPRSLVKVVVCWNIPTHIWLKNYVFQVCKPLGSFFAIIMTYLISSFLHGFNLRLAAVLLSLGFYTYIEYQFRLKLSIIFNACIGANSCKKCDHLYKTHFYVYLTNAVFSVIAIFHLAYLGCLLESASDASEPQIDLFMKWKHLDFASLIFIVFQYMVYKLI